MNRPALGDVALRVVIGGLAGAIAGIHLNLWSSYGYRHIPTIGALFMLNAIGGAVLALANLTLPRRVVPWAWLGTAGFAMATLVALLVSLNGKLFGFAETTSAPLVAPSIGLEAALLVLASSVAFCDLLARRQRSD